MLSLFMLGIFLTAEAAFHEQLNAVQWARLTHLLHMSHCCLLGLSCLTAEKTFLFKGMRNPFWKGDVRKEMGCVVAEA